MVTKRKASTLPARIGRYYKDIVPDTLDLAERARLSLNHLTSIISEEDDYEMGWLGIFNPLGIFSEFPRPVITFRCSPLMACQPKCMEAMAMARIMSGSQQNLERETKMIKMLASHIGKEGIYWVPKYADKPWLGPEKYRPYANMHGQARMMRAMVAWYQYTGDSKWKRLIDRMLNGIDSYLVVHKGDYAYFPVSGWINGEYFSSCYVKGRGWKSTKEPKDEKHGEEGSLFNHQGHTPGVLANWYLLTGNKQALRLSGELVRFLTKPKFWADWKAGEYPNVIGAEHAHWHGHFYGHINTLRAILEYAIATNDVQLKNFVREGYEWARHPWLIGRGLFGANGQGCATPRLIGLAIKLSDEGIGDYWEDVDIYIRNHGTEMQFTMEDIPYLKSFGEKRFVPGKEPRMLKYPHGFMTTKDVLESSIGAFSMDPFKLAWALCCSPWGCMGFYYAWDGTLRYANGIVRVNLLLNHASPWMDIESYLPYEGKVVLRNKTAKNVFVRIPLWAEKKSAVCQIGKRVAKPAWFGNYLYIEHLKPKDVITIEFPVKERTEQWTTDETFSPDLPCWPGKVTRSFRFRGNTLVEISPPLPDWRGKGHWWLYQGRAKKFKASKAPMTEVTRFVTPLSLRW